MGVLNMLLPARKIPFVTPTMEQSRKENLTKLGGDGSLMLDVFEIIHHPNILHPTKIEK